MIAALPRFVLRCAGIGLLLIAFGVTYPLLARAQSADTDQPDNGENAPAKPPVSNPEAAAPADAAPAEADTAAPGPASSAKPDSASKPDSAAKADTSSPGHYELHEASKEFPSHTGDETFDHASDSFPAFCRDWQRRLHDRELNNQESVAWKDKDGYKTGTYLAYSPIKTCACKRSTGGVPIGELTYQETEFYLVGRTIEEARHAQPKPVGITNTTEIFRWDKTKWDDGR